MVHRGVVRLVRNTDYVRLDSEDRVAQCATVSFDASTFEIWGALLNGARVVVVGKETAISPQAFAEEMERDGISTVFLTTVIFNQMVRELPGMFKGLKQVLFGGEVVDPGAVRSILGDKGPKRLLHVYGPTESTTFTTSHRVEEVGARAWTVPIGRPIGNTRVYLLDGQLRVVPVRVTGELCIGGDGLARGYLNRPDLTAEKFVPDAFSKVGGERLYRTGDLARYLADGNIEYVGRMDQQVKLRGYRIELGEIESVLRQHPGVEQSVVILHEDGVGEKRLVGYVVSKGDGKADVEGIRKYVKERLPEYMVPMIMMLEAMPLTANGKVDRKGLPAPVGRGARVSVGPRNGTEEMLAGIFEQVLGVERVGVHDNFFDLGGHSLLATRLVSRVRELFEVELPLREVFEAPTVAGMGERVEALRGRGINVPAIQRVGREGPLGLSHAQERLWLIDQLQPGSVGYNMPGVLRIAGKLEVGVLERAINEIVRRHEALRTTFEMGEGNPVQRIRGYERQVMPWVDLKGLSPEERERTARQWIGEESVQPFDMKRGPLVRVRLLQMSESEQVISYTLHHIISDGWSMGVLNRELGTLYEAFAAGGSTPLAELAVQYADFAVWQRDWLAGGEMEKQLGYWQKQLGGLSPLQLPGDRVRPVMQSYNGGGQELRISAETAEGLKRLGQEGGLTLYMVLLAGFGVLLSRYSGQEDIAVGTPIANRNREEIEGLIGFFVNTLVMRMDMSGDPSVRELLERVKEVSLGAYGHQDVPFEKVVEELQPERDLSRNPLVQVIFALQNAAG